MKLATYNIASGGFTDYASTSQTPERLGLLQKAIKSVDASILGLTDTFRWAKTFTPSDIKAAFGYDHSFHIDMNDTRVNSQIGVALLSKIPITSPRAVRLYNRNAIQATLHTPTLGEVDIFVVYLDDLSDATRQKQVEALLALISADRPTVIMGDLNAVWPRHVALVKKQTQQFIKAHPEFAKRPDYQQLQNVFDNFYTATTLPLLENHGFSEPQPQPLPTALTPLHSLGLPTIFPVDHLLAKNCTVTNYHVHTGQAFQRASDHYPLSAVLAL